MIEFVEYTGKYPNLCRGVLVLTVDGKEYIFGGKRVGDKLVPLSSGFGGEQSDYDNNGRLKAGLYESFWGSGGSVWFDDSWNAYVDDGEWNIDVDSLPDELKAMAEEIAEVFNANVPYGCCGGCI